MVAQASSVRQRTVGGTSSATVAQQIRYYYRWNKDGLFIRKEDEPGHQIGGVMIS